MNRSSAPRPGGGAGQPLGIYLNDHLAGATGGAELARRMAGAQRGSSGDRDLARLAREISEDLAALRDIMAALGIPVRRYKAAAGWLGEKAGRLKPNGRLVSRSPLSSVLELEMMRLGVEGKASGWRTLRELARTDDRLDADRLDTLLERAREQADTLEELRVRRAAETFGP
jgi:hypothetical protein